MHWKFTNPDFRALSSRYNSWRLYRREKCTPDRNEERNKEKEKVRATIMVIIASLRRFKMNFYSGQSRFVGDKKEKKKKKKRRRNFKCENTCGSNSHFDGRILRDETISLSSRYMIILFFSFWFFFFRIGDIQNAIVFFVFSLSHRSLFSLPHSFTLFFIFLDLFFFLFFFFSQNDKNRDVSNRNDFSRSINRMALSLGDSYNHFSYTQWQSTTSHINDWRKRLTHIYRNIHVSTDNTGYKKI